MVATIAAGLGVEPSRVGVASTGVIGVRLEFEPVLDGDRAGRRRARARRGRRHFSEAILTSDRGRSDACLEMSLPAGPVLLGAQCKGAGMISPDFATTLCFVETDAAFEPPASSASCATRRRALSSGSPSTGSFRRATPCSRSRAGGPAARSIRGATSERAFAASLEALFRQLALEIVADGEGASRVARLVVRGPDEAVEPVARAVGNSPLVKCALHGADPNWGRILQAAGQALAGGSGEMDLAIEGIAVVKAGDDLPLAEGEQHRLDEAMRAAEVEIELALAGGDAEAELFFCDLGHEYVSFNSEYTT